VTIALLGVTALALAGSSLGGLTPQLRIATAGGQALSITVSRQQADDPVGRVELVVPTGFTLASPAVGALVGTATAKIVSRDVDPNTEQLWSGAIRSISATDPTVAYESTSCDPVDHLAAWMVRLSAGKQTFGFPIFVDAASGTSAPFGPYVLVACFRPPDLASTDPNRSARGSVVDSFTLTSTRFGTPTTAGSYLWRSFWTPFSAGTGELNTTAAVEAQSAAVVPAGEVDLAATTSTARAGGIRVVLVTVFGRVLVGGVPTGSVVVRLRRGHTPTKLVGLGRVTTGGDGVYLDVVALLRTSYFQAIASIPAKDLGAAGCQASFPDIPCLDATTGAGRVASATVTASP
jgi:hypothetical protein